MASPQERAPMQGQMPASTVTSARDVVSVACKLPNGVIIREMTEATVDEPILGGGMRQVTYHQPTGQQVLIEGTASRFGAPPPLLVNGGYRITRDVSKKVWDSWLSANKNSDLVRNHLIYASEKHDDAKAFAREHEKAVSGMEGVDPDKPSKHVRGIVRGDRPNLKSRRQNYE